MGAKLAALCLVSIASPLLAANEIPFSMNVALSKGSTNSTTITQQVVDRFRKGDRLPIMQAMPKTDMREVPDRKIDTDCEPPIDVPGIKYRMQCWTNV